MKKLQIIILSILGLVLISPAIVAAVAAYPVGVGGTGVATIPVSQLMYGKGTSPIGTVATGTLSGAANQFSFTGTPYVVNGSTVLSVTNPFIITGLEAFASSTIGDGTAKGGLTINGGATTTGSFLILGSTTLQNFTAINSTSSQATSSALAILNILNCNTTSALTTNSIGSIVCGAITGGGGSASNLFTTITNFNQTSSATNTLLSLQASPVALAASGTIEGQFIDTDIFSGFQQGDMLLGYASTSNRVTIWGIQAGGKSATTTTAGSDSTAIGYQALNGQNNGTQNTAVGSSALSGGSSGTGNAAYGYNALSANTSGTHNVGVGNSTGGVQTSGSNNTFLGFSIDSSGSSGARKQNTISGASAAASLGVNSDDNALYGYFSGNAMTTGAYGNTFFGSLSGQTLTSGHGDMLLGYNSLPQGGNTASNILNIANYIFGSLPATTSATTLSVPTSGMFSIGSTSPYAEFSIQANNGYPTTTLFAIGSSTSNSTTTLLFVNNIGQLTIGSSTNQNGAYLNIDAGSSATTTYITSNVAGFNQSIFQNTSANAAASADLVVCNNLSLTGSGCPSYFGDFGINSSAYSQAGFTGQSANDVFLTSSDSNLDIGTASSTGPAAINFMTAGFNTANLRGIITAAGLWGIGSSTPSIPGLNIGNGTASSSLLVAQYSYGIGTNLATSTAITINSTLGSNNLFFPIGGSATTITLCLSAGQHVLVKIQNPNQTAGAITWATCAGETLTWPSQTIPTQTTGANRSDLWSFVGFDSGGSPATSTRAIVISGAQTAGF